MITEEIDNAIAELSYTKAEILQLPSEDARRLYDELLNSFVEGGDRRWWWESFSMPSITVDFADGKGFELITELVPDKDKHVWFVAEEDQLPFYPIYESNPRIIQQIIGECSFFEYYIIPKTKKWILCENHHNQLVGAGDTVTNALLKYAK